VTLKYGFQVYERVGRPLVDSVMEGFNAAVIGARYSIYYTSLLH
jgi:hypothetical protein